MDVTFFELQIEIEITLPGESEGSWMRHRGTKLCYHSNLEEASDWILR